MPSVISDASYLLNTDQAGCACLVQLSPGEKRIMITSVQESKSSTEAELLAGILGFWYLKQRLGTWVSVDWYVDSTALHRWRGFAGNTVTPAPVRSSGIKKIHHKCHKASRRALESLEKFQVKTSDVSINGTSINLNQYISDLT